MNTINPREDMFADFFQVDGFANATGILFGLNNTMDVIMTKNMPFSSLAQKGKFSTVYRQHDIVRGRLKNSYGFNDSELNAIFSEFKKQGGNYLDANGFFSYVDQIMKSQRNENTNVEPPKVESPKEVSDIVDVSDVDYTEPPKKDLSVLWIGLGVVALVGITVLLVRRK